MQGQTWTRGQIAQVVKVSSGFGGFLWCPSTRAGPRQRTFHIDLAQCAALLKIARADYTKEDASRSKKTALAKGSCHEVALHHVGESVTVFCFSDCSRNNLHFSRKKYVPFFGERFQIRLYWAGRACVSYLQGSRGLLFFTKRFISFPFLFILFSS